MFNQIHPLLVHFPIAFLGLYAVLELARFKFLRRQAYWFYVKATLAIAGAAIVWPTVFAGELMEEQFKGTVLAKVIEVHSTFGGITAIIFSIIGLAYLIEWYRVARGMQAVGTTFGAYILRGAHWLVESKLIMLLALAGLITIFITGALGASMVYGPESDPFVSFVYHLFFNS